MSILKVARMGHPVLRACARPLERQDIKSARVQTLIDDMIETMLEYRCSMILSMNKSSVIGHRCPEA